MHLALESHLKLKPWWGLFRFVGVKTKLLQWFDLGLLADTFAVPACLLELEVTMASISQEA